MDKEYSLLADEIEMLVKKGLEKMICTEECTVSEAYKLGFEHAIELIKDSFGLI